MKHERDMLQKKLDGLREMMDIRGEICITVFVSGCGIKLGLDLEILILEDLESEC